MASILPTLTPPPTCSSAPRSQHTAREDLIERAYINGFCAAFSGDCPAVAGALAHVFDADTLVWLVDQPEDVWPVHAYIRKDGRLYDAHGQRTRNDLRSLLESHVEAPGMSIPPDFDLDTHIDEHDPSDFEILDETGLAQSIIDERLVPAARGTKTWA